MLAEEAPAATTRSKQRILVVDDDECTRTAVAWLFRPEYEVVVAGDGLEGIDAAMAGPPPDLIIADVWMPRVDGIAMVERMRAIDRLMRVPVIFLTGQVSVPSIAAGISVGARHYLLKPVDPDELERKVRRALRHDSWH